MLHWRVGPKDGRGCWFVGSCSSWWSPYTVSTWATSSHFCPFRQCKFNFLLLRVTAANEITISNHIWIALTHRETNFYITHTAILVSDFFFSRYTAKLYANFWLYKNSFWMRQNIIWTVWSLNLWIIICSH